MSIAKYSTKNSIGATAPQRFKRTAMPPPDVLLRDLSSAVRVVWVRRQRCRTWKPRSSSVPKKLPVRSHSCLRRIGWLSA
jgi:hypothetical protein